MDRQEAIQELKRMAATIEWDYPLDAQIAIEKAVAALEGPKSDPATGLVPCGCGGEPVIKQGKSRKYPFRVYCPMCFMKADKAKNEEDAKFFWNHGMGNFNT